MSYAAVWAEIGGMSAEWMMQSAEPPVMTDQAVRDANLKLHELAALADLEELAELLPAQRTEVMADALDEARRRLALSSLLQNRLALDSPAVAAEVKLLNVLSEVADASTMMKALVQAEAETDLQMAMLASVVAHSEARLAVSDAEEALATGEAGPPGRRVDWSAEQDSYAWLWQAAAALSFGATTAKRLVMADEQGRQDVARAADRVSKAGLCRECILHRMRLAPAGSHPSKAWAYEQPLDRCPHTGPFQAVVARVDPDSGLWRRDLP